MARQRIDYDINADISKSLQQAAQYEQILSRIDKEWDSVNRKSRENGGTVTYKETLTGHGLNNQLTAATRDIQRSIESMVKQMQSVKRNGTSSQYDQLHSAITRLTNVLASNVNRSGATSWSTGTANTPLNKFLTEKERTGSLRGVPTGVSKGATFQEQSEIQKNTQKFRNEISQFRRSVSAVESTQQRLGSSYDKSVSSGRINYRANQNFNSDYSRNSDMLSKTALDIQSTLKGWQDQRSSIVSKRNTLQERSNSGAVSDKDVAQIQKQIVQYDKQISLYSENINLLKSFNERLSEASSNQKEIKKAFDGSVATGQVKVQNDPSSFLGILYNRRAAIGGMVATTAANTYLNSVDSGNVLRKNAYGQFGSSYTAQGLTGSFDNALQSSLVNGTTQGFSGKETSGFMAAYSEYLGTKRAVSGAQQLGAWARYGGLGADTTNQLSGTLEQLGTVTSPTDIKNIAEAFTGSLKESGLSGQAKIQGQALNSVLSTMRGQQVSSREVNGVGNLLNSLGQNPRFRGEAGAQALTSLQGLFYNGTNNRFLTNAWTSSNPGKYLSAHGQAQLQEDMQNPFAHPKEMQNTLNYYLRQYKDTDIAAYQLSSDSGNTINMAQAKEWLKQSRSGNITRQFSKDNRKTGRRQLDRSEEDFSQSGVSSVLQQQGYTDQGNATASRSMDSTRSTINPLRSNPLIASTASAGGSLLQQTAGIAIGTAAGEGLFKSVGAGAGAGALSLGAAGTGGTGALAALGGGLSGLGSFLLPLAASGATATGLVKSAQDITSGNRGQQTTGFGTASLIGGGMTLGGLLGGPVGALAGAAAGTAASALPGISNGVGGIERGFANGVNNIFNPPKAKAATVSGGSTKNTWITGNQNVIQGYNKMLDKMIKAADILKKALLAQGKGGSGSGDSDSGGVEDIANGDMKANAQSISDYIKKHVKGATSEAIAGLLGNLQQESGLDPSKVEAGGGGGHGLAQWTGARWNDLQRYAQSKGKSWDDLGLQLDFMFNGDGANSNILKNLLTSKGSVSELTQRIESQYERAGAPAMGQRINYANSWYKTLGRKAQGTITSRPQIDFVGEKGAEAIVPLTDRVRGKSILRSSANYLNLEILDKDTDPYGMAGGNQGAQELNLAPSFNITVRSNGEETLDQLKKQGNAAVDYIFEQLQKKVNSYSNQITRG